VAIASKVRRHSYVTRIFKREGSDRQSLIC
jgi:hypothetical protein